VEGGRALFQETTLAGLYRVRGGDFRREIAVNLLNREESNTVPSDQLRFGRRVIASSSGGARSAREIWRWIAFTAVLLLAVEWYVYHRRI
jgi:hypothetical protein